MSFIALNKTLFFSEAAHNKDSDNDDYEYPSLLATITYADDSSSSFLNDGESSSESESSDDESEQQTRFDLYIQMEFCESNLQQRLNASRIESEERKRIFKEIVEGLHYIHSRSIVHRDLKPPNIMLKNGVVKIGDFGISISANKKDKSIFFKHNTHNTHKCVFIYL